MTRLIQLMVMAVLMSSAGLVSTTSASAGCRNCEGGSAPQVVDTICLDEATWEAEKHHFRVVKGYKRNYWYPMTRACLAGNLGCLKRGKSYRRCATFRAALGSEYCHKSPVTGKVTVWKIDGVKRSE